MINTRAQFPQPIHPAANGTITLRTCFNPSDPMSFSRITCVFVTQSQRVIAIERDFYIVGGPGLRRSAGDGENTMMLAPFVGVALILSVATGPTVEPNRSTENMSVGQKNAALQRFVRIATDCIARTVAA